MGTRPVLTTDPDWMLLLSLLSLKKSLHIFTNVKTIVKTITLIFGGICFLDFFIKHKQTKNV